MTHTFWLAVLGFVLASNPFHRRPVLPVTGRDPDPAVAVVAAGAVLTMGVLSLMAVAGSATLDALDISVANGRVAAGLIVVLAAAVQFVRTPTIPNAGEFVDMPRASPGSVAAVTPVFFPALLRPELALLALVGGADVGWGPMAAAVVIGTALVVVWVWVAKADRWTARFERAFDRLVCVGLLLMGIDQIVDGVLAV